MNGLCDSYCRGCTYLCGNCDTYKMCNYLDMTGERRPCPAGTGCTVRKIGGRFKKALSIGGQNGKNHRKPRKVRKPDET